MSDNQLAYQYGYLTITGEGDALQLIEHYQLRRAEGWNAGEIAEDRYQFECMCIRINLGLLELDNAEFWWASLKHLTVTLNTMPATLQRTLHVVTHGANSQNAGFYLSRENIRLLARLNTALHVHGYQDADDGHDFPYTRVLTPALIPHQAGEQASFYISSALYHSEQLQALINLPSEKQYSKGDIKRYDPVRQQPIYQTISRIEIKSGLPATACIVEHVEALLNLLESQQAQLWQMAQDYHIEFGITASGYMSNPHKRFFPAQTIERLAKLGLILDCDFYFNDSF
ncbi:DUF4279 domain-containing protein [Alkanindiges illinoisensis]|uniref:DUF4279 domain-containing protein n=1 Tax=Alkanindiges illinoisensis TaxID=197183 RepID=UPI00047B3301|nr:DUF4279 domain-containing protein [Alkanindiges illinoisensis]